MRTILQAKSQVLKVLVTLAFCVGFSVEAQARVYDYRVLLPNGKPAVGAKVRAVFGVESWERFALEAGKVRDVRTQTNAQGKFKVELQGEKEALAFVVVDAPGCDLAFWNFLPAKKPLQLKAEQPLTGKVARDENTPVGGATVIVTTVGTSTYGPLFLQDPRDVQFPKATATTGVDGSFRLRGVSLNGYEFNEGVDLWAVAKINGQNWMGETDRSNMKTPLVIKIAPSVSIHGSVVHYATGQPLTGARVEYSDYALGHEPVFTDAEGRFRFNDLPGNFARSLTITHPDFPGAVMRVATDPKVIDDKQLKPELVVALRPLAKVTGKMVDETTRGPLPFSIGLSAIWMQKSSGWTFSMGAVSSTDAQVGTFAFSAPVGSLRLIASPSMMGMDNSILEAIDRPLEVPLAGIENLSIPARRQSGYWLKFAKANEADGWPGFIIQKRTPDGWQYLTSSPGYSWFSPAEKWGESIEVRGIVDNNTQKEIFPVTKIVADPKNWPIIISLPAKTK